MQTFKEKMESEGWHNCYSSKPPSPGWYKIYRRNGSTGKAYYYGNSVWEQGHNGWEIIWWKELERR